MDHTRIRNFSIIAHIDAGKSTLADRIMEITGAIAKDKLQPQMLDSNPIERERGITIKLAPVTLSYQGHTLNLIDTPGHVDFNYEVERALQACETAILLVDATKGVQAQTVANYHLAKKANLDVIPVVNKIDAPLADTPASIRQLKTMLGQDTDPLLISAKTGEGVSELLDCLISHAKPPQIPGSDNLSLFVFNSTYDSHLGVIAFVKVITGSLRASDKLIFKNSGQAITVAELGIFSPHRQSQKALDSGQVGYIITGLKDIRKVLIGDTLCLPSQSKLVPAEPGFRRVLPNVYLDLYPSDGSQYQDLVDAVEKLKLNDSSLTTSGVNSPILGLGVKVGFLGLLHSEVVIERLSREFDLSVLAVSPSVEYKIKLRNQDEKVISSAQDFPDPSQIESGFEPVADIRVVVTQEYLGAVMQLCQELRAEMVNMSYIDELVEVDYKMPLVEVITSLHDSLKSVSSGFASVDYQISGWQRANLVRLDVMLNHEVYTPFSIITVQEKMLTKAKSIAQKLKDSIPRHQFPVPVQVAVGGQIIAREDIRPFRKDVESKLHGGDFTRNLKLLQKQKKGKARMKQFGKVQLPPTAFLAIVKS
jgi:GTP-binding protein LepA